MSEQTRSRPRETGGPDSGGNPFAADDPLGNIAYVISSGGQREALPVAGMTVAQIRTRLVDRMNIDPRAQPMIGSQNVADDVVVKPGEHLFFRRAAGEKGSGARRAFLRPRAVREE